MESWKLGLALFCGSLALTIILWMIGLPFFFLFLFIPIIPFLRRTTVRRCPVCGWETTGSERFCPFDATPLGESGGDGGNGKD